MNAERRQALIDRAKRLDPPDVAAIAILEAGRDYKPEPPDHLIFSAKPWAGLRWAA